MTAVSAASGPASFSHASHPQDDYTGWDNGSNGRNENPLNNSFDDYESFDSPEAAPIAQNGVSHYDHSENYTTPRESRSNSRAAPYPQTKRMHDGTIMTYDDENSKWIHRDKLAKIESEELQAAGIVLPKPRAQSRSRRDRSQDKPHSRRRGTTDSADPQYIPRSRKNSDLGHDKAPDVEVPTWDLRLPEEIAEDPGEYWVSNDSGRGTRIPVAKLSPAPIPVDYIDRNTPVQRKQSNPLLNDETSIAYPRTRSRSNSNVNTLDDFSKPQLGKRSVTEGSPKKSTAAVRKTSAPTKSTTPARPKTRSGTNPRSSSTTRPSTRSGEVSSPRAPEGEPPWMVSAYQPDPRLPPEQQLLPTVAKRLQQEKWEQEGSFGNIYDKEFRPLNENPLSKPPELEKSQQENEEQQEEWPLKPESRVPTPSRPGTSSYSTMPKIQGTPAMSPLGGPRPIQQMHTQTTTAAVMIPEPPAPEQAANQKSGCGCCLVM